MFFIFGMPRSGTTLLAQCLSAHKDIVVPYETDFIIPMAFIFDRIREPQVGRELIYKLIINSKSYSSLSEYIDSQVIKASIYDNDYHPAAILRSIFAEIAQAADAKIAGDKSPNDLNFLRMLVKTGGLSSETKVIHIVRDVRDVMVSLGKTGWVSDLELYFPRFWSNQNLYLNSIRQHDESTYLLIRYEDLVARPQEILASVFGFLGFESDRETVLPSRRHPRYKDHPQVHENLYNPITTKRIGIYKNNIDQKNLSAYERQAYEALAAFGYL